MLTKISPTNSIDNEVNEAEVSTLANAARISHMISHSETTIGAFSLQSKPPVETKTTRMTSVQRQPSKDPWKRDVWNTVNLEMEKKRNIGTAINLKDCKAIQIKMAMKNAERIRQKQVRLEMAQRQNKLNELDEMMQNLKIESYKKSATKLQKNLLFKEQEIVEIVQQIEIQSQIAEEQAKREIEDHSKKMVEKMNRLKREEEIRGYFQSIKSMKELFIMLFEKFVKTCISNQLHLKNFQQYSEAREGFLMRYEALIKLVNSGQISSAEVSSLEGITDDIKEMQRAVDEEIKTSEELERTIADRKELLRLEEDKLQQQKQQEQRNQQELQQQELQQQQQHQQPQQQLPQLIRPADSNGFVNSERLSHYQMIMKFYEEYVDSVKPLQSDDTTKKFRFDCKKCVNILSNSISSASAKHLQDKFDRLALILSGNSVEIVGTRVTPSHHPLGVRFVNLLVAKMFVKQADTAIDVSPKAAFPIASLIVALWDKFPDFGKLFLAYLYKTCPFLVPYFMQQAQGQSDEEYLKSIGYTFVNNICEDQTKYLKRLTGLVRLYTSVLISKTRRASTRPHPHGIEFAWSWLANVLNLDPVAEITATMIHEFVLIAGSELWKCYKKQFVKVLGLIHTQYMAQLTLIETGGPQSRLDGLIRKILQEQKIDPPSEVLPANFW